MKRRNVLLIVGSVILLGIGGWFVVQSIVSYQQSAEARKVEQDLQTQIQSVIDTRRSVQLGGEDAEPFDEQGIVKVLLIGLDSRSGSTLGHCDAIQFIEIDKTNQTVNITAVPRGTYSPLPGTGHLPSDYYVSNACGIGGLDYGITQIENILGQKADYVVVVGFSEALGAFRLLGLPTTETLQWLRLRQGYAIGEPQRAHNHSTFLKQLLVKFTPTNNSQLDTVWEYLLYQLVDSDLSFKQTQDIVSAFSVMDLANHSERIGLSMKPAYAVAEIPYNSENLDEYLSARLDSISGQIPEGAYTGISEPEEQQQLMDLINAGLEDTDFVKRAFEQKLWLQIDDKATRESVHFAFLSKYLSQISDNETGKNLLADYIIEMEIIGQTEWAKVGRELLVEKFGG
jgi:anionic cell wall polymer biosynthesis LytR-Cps2A-Psr (LCP) family protein